MAETCVRCKRAKQGMLPHSGVYTVRNGKLVTSIIKFVCPSCRRKAEKWHAAL